MPFTEKDGIDPQQAKIIGALIRKTKKERGFSTEHLAALSGISQQSLSEIERGKKKLSWHALTAVFSTLSLSFNPSYSLIEQARQLFSDFLYAYFAQKSEAETFLLSLQNSEFKTSFAYPYSLLAEYILAVLHGSASLEELESNLKMMDSALDGMQKKCFHLFKGLHLAQNHQLHEAFDQFETGLECAFTAKAAEDLKYGLVGLLFYQASLIQGKTNDFTKAIFANRKAKDYFDQSNHYRLSLQCEAQLSFLYTQMRQYQNAIKQSQRALELSDLLDQPTLKKPLQINLCTASFYLKDYAACLKTASALFPQDARILYFMMISAYKLHDKRQAKQTQRLLLELEPPLYYRLWAQALFSDSSTALDLLEKAYQQALLSEGEAEQVFILEWILQENPQALFPDRILSYQNQLIRLLRSQK